MLNITSDQWNKYSLKYSKLMWTIAHRISGDTMTASLEDNFSDLSIAALESINGFHKKTGKSFDEMIDMKLFDQYTKTCLWTAKARKGIKLTDKMPFRNKHISIDQLREDTEGNFDVADASSVSRYSVASEISEMKAKACDKTKKLIDVLQSNSDLISEGCNIKLKTTAKALETSVGEVQKIIKIVKVKNKHD